jgi:V/A-type H+/Na+-transporting ATPase subunit E
MDSRVQEIIEKIKREAVDEARAEAASLLADAETSRQQILSAAEKEARLIVEQARLDAKRTQEAGNAALQQAARTLIRAFRGEIEKLLAETVRSEVQGAYDEATLKRVLPIVLEAWADKDSDDLTVLLPETELENIRIWAKAHLNKKLAAGIELKPIKGCKAGFRIMEKDGTAYYDFSAEAVAEMLAAYLNQHMAGLIAEAAS